METTSKRVLIVVVISEHRRHARSERHESGQQHVEENVEADAQRRESCDVTGNGQEALQLLQRPPPSSQQQRSLFRT